MEAKLGCPAPATPWPVWGGPTTPGVVRLPPKGENAKKKKKKNLKLFALKWELHNFIKQGFGLHAVIKITVCML